MTTKKNDGGPAFPSVTSMMYHPGMTLRDYFAIHAPEPNDDKISDVIVREKNANPHGDSYKPPRRSWREIEVALRYEYADAMIAEREK